MTPTVDVIIILTISEAYSVANSLLKASLFITLPWVLLLSLG